MIKKSFYVAVTRKTYLYTALHDFSIEKAAYTSTGTSCVQSNDMLTYSHAWFIQPRKSCLH